MSETKFTPGPWILENRLNICDEYDCFLQPINLHIHDRISDADAHLIAAAPDMYAELEAAMNVFRFYQGHHAAKGHSEKEQTNKQYADRIAKVLEKARGEA